MYMLIEKKKSFSGAKLIPFFLRFPYRYYAIVHPLKAQYHCTLSRAKKTVLLAWMTAFLLGIPVLFVQVSGSNKRMMSEFGK